MTRQLTFEEYVESLWKDLPIEVYIYACSIFVFSSLLAISLKGYKSGVKYSAIFFLVEYIILVFSSTVLFRATREGRGYCLMPFWSYFEIAKGNREYIAENIMNVLVFIPIGFLSKVVKLKLRHVIFMGIVISSLIECSQFLFNLGFSEIDDIIHNTVGCALGWILLKTIIVIKKKSAQYVNS